MQRIGSRPPALRQEEADGGSTRGLSVDTAPRRRVRDPAPWGQSVEVAWVSVRWHCVVKREPEVSSTSRVGKGG
jgi:hypothetical protein